MSPIASIVEMKMAIFASSRFGDLINRGVVKFVSSIRNTIYSMKVLIFIFPIADGRHLDASSGLSWSLSRYNSPNISSRYVSKADRKHHPTGDVTEI
jgi:hypothetical protein